MATQQNVPSKLVDRPDVPETYGDAIRSVWFDGTWRIEVDVLRLDPTSVAEGRMTATQHPSCRLVLSVAAGLALIDKLNQLSRELEANGTVRRTAPAPGVTH
jgi:hypothetical protein